MARDLKLDGLKSILIFLVVLGHLSFKEPLGIPLHRIIYAFHMPAFVFVSGYLTSPYYTPPEKRRKWLRQTLLIYVIAQILHILLDTSLGNTVDVKTLLMISPSFSLWYLISLIWWRLMAWHLFVHSKGKDMDMGLFAASLLLAVTVGFIPISQDFSFQRTFAFLPCFVSGYLCRKYRLTGAIERTPIGISLLVLLMGITVSAFVPTYIPRWHYASLPAGMKDMLIRAVQTGQGLLLTLCIFRLSRSIPLERLTKWGAYSLWIYIGHALLVRINPIERMQMHFWGLKSDLLEALTIATLYCIVFSLLAGLYYKNKMKIPWKRS